MTGSFVAWLMSGSFRNGRVAGYGHAVVNIRSGSVTIVDSDVINEDDGCDCYG